MSIIRENIKQLVSFTTPTVQGIGTGSALFDLGIIKTEALANDFEVLVRYQTQFGGALAPRNSGEAVQVEMMSPEYLDDSVTMQAFGKAMQTAIEDMYSVQDPESINPEVAMSWATITSQHVNALTMQFSNLTKAFGHSLFLPNASYFGNTWTNAKVGNTLPFATWSNNATDIWGQILNVKDNFFSVGYGTEELTLIVAPNVMNYLYVNESIINAARGLGIQAAAIGDNGLTRLNESQVRQVFAGFGVFIVSATDRYYNKSVLNATDDIHANALTFMPANSVTAIPMGFELTNNNGLTSYQARQQDMVKIFATPDKAFPRSATSGMPSYGAEANGMYLFQSIMQLDDNNPAVLNTRMTSKLTGWTNAFAKINHAANVA